MAETSLAEELERPEPEVAVEGVEPAPEPAAEMFVPPAGALAAQAAYGNAAVGRAARAPGVGPGRVLERERTLRPGAAPPPRPPAAAAIPGAPVPAPSLAGPAATRPPATTAPPAPALGPAATIAPPAPALGLAAAIAVAPPGPIPPAGAAAAAGAAAGQAAAAPATAPMPVSGPVAEALVAAPTPVSGPAAEALAAAPAAGPTGPAGPARSGARRDQARAASARGEPAPPEAPAPSGAAAPAPPPEAPVAGAVSQAATPSRLLRQLLQSSPLRAPSLFPAFIGGAMSRLEATRAAETATPLRAHVEPQPAGSAGPAPSPPAPSGPGPVTAPAPAAPVTPAAGAPPAVPEAATHTGAPPEVRVEDPLPRLKGLAADVTGLVEWARSWLTRLLAAIPRTDPGLTTDPGPAPTVPLADATDLGQLEQWRSTKRARLDQQTAASARERAQGFGEDAIAPDLSPQDLQAAVGDRTEAERPACTPAEEAAPLAFDPADEADLAGRVRELQAGSYEEQLARMEEAERQRDEQLAAARGDAAKQVEELHDAAYEEQAEIDADAQARIGELYAGWAAEDERLIRSYQDLATRRGAGVTEEIEGFKRQQDATIDARYKDTAAKAKDKKAEAEQATAEVHKEAEEDSDSWFSRGLDWLGDKISGAFSWAIDQITYIVNEARDTIAGWFDDLTEWAVGLIEDAQEWIIDKLEGFEAFLNEKVDEYLADYPRLAAVARFGIGVTIGTAKAGVNATAWTLKTGVEVSLGFAAEVIDGALALAELVVVDVLHVTCGLMVTGLNLLNLLVEHDLDAAIKLIRDLPEPAMVGPLWPIVKAGLIGFLEHLRDLPADRKKRLIMKILSLAVSLDFYGGYVLGVIRGFVWDGLLGIVRLLWDLIKFLPELVRGLYRFLEMLVTDTEAITRVETAVASLGSELAAFIEREDAVQQIVELLKGAPSLLFGMLRQLGVLGRQLANKAGHAMAEALVSHVERSSDYDLGVSVGRIVGEIAFEVVAAIFTAGGSLVLKVASKTIQLALKALRLLLKGVMAAGRLIVSLLRGIAAVARGGLRLARKLGPAIGNVLEKVRQLLDDVVEWFLRGFRRMAPGVRRAGERIKELALRIFKGMGFSHFEVKLEGDELVLYGISSKVQLARFKLRELPKVLSAPSAAIRKLIHARASLLGKAAKLPKKLAQRARGAVSPYTEKIGEFGAKRAVARLRGWGKPVHTGKGAGDLDLVYQKGREFLVVEAKGGAGKRGFRTVGGVAYEQGTPGYLRAVLAEMIERGTDPKLARKLLKALREGRVRYLYGKTPIRKAGPLKTRLREFKLRK